MIEHIFYFCLAGGVAMVIGLPIYFCYKEDKECRRLYQLAKGHREEVKDE
jgi:hypothetical protein